MGTEPQERRRRKLLGTDQVEEEGGHKHNREAGMRKKQEKAISI